MFFDMCLFNRELIGSVAVIFLSRVQYRLYPIRMVGTVGVFLALQTYADVLRIFQTVLADDVGITTYTLEITGIYLYTRLVSIHLHEDACLGRIQACTYLSVITFGVQTEIMVISCGILNLVE